MLKGETTPEEFKNIYHSPDAKLTSLLDCENSANQTNVPKAISVSYSTALIQHIEQDSNSLCLSEEDTPKNTQSPN